MLTTLYARVSGSTQEKEATIMSQLSQLQERLKVDRIKTWEEFRDEGYSRDQLNRPALDKLRDLIASGGCDKLYIHAPDRLASGAKLILLVEEFQKHQVEVVFLVGATDDSPEGKLLLGVQGIIADYERTKIAERTRRGKLYWAKQGFIVGGYAAFGYKHVRDGGRRTLTVIDDEKAAIVRNMYQWLVEEGLSLRGIASRLSDAGIPTRSGLSRWTPGTIQKILNNEVYCGVKHFQRVVAVEPKTRRENRIYRKTSKTSSRLRPIEDWIPVAVPPIISRQTWLQAQERFKQNAIFAARNNGINQYLLRGLVRCGICGYAYSGAACYGRRLYRCSSKDTPNGCKHRPNIKADALEELVWMEVSDILRNPHLVIQEYEKRLLEACDDGAIEAERKRVENEVKRIKAQEERLLDIYVDGGFTKDKVNARMTQLNYRLAAIEQERKALDQKAGSQAMIRENLEQIESFCERIKDSLETVTFEERQKILRLVVERIVITGKKVRIEVLIPKSEAKEKEVLCPPAQKK